ncbi:MAG: hypothetical protein HKN60_02090 [Rhizobiales bacterium]|nr:hypothetical protein [Hyphomicrobiales bacterium]
MTRPAASMVLAALLAVAWLNAAAAQNASQEIVVHDVIGCTREQAAIAFTDAMNLGDQVAMNQYLADEVCSSFASISYRPVRIVRRGTDPNDLSIVHAKVFHLMDLFILTRPAIPAPTPR